MVANVEAMTRKEIKDKIYHILHKWDITYEFDHIADPITDILLGCESHKVNPMIGAPGFYEIDEPDFKATLAVFKGVKKMNEGE